MGFTQAPEQAAVQALLSCGKGLDQGWKLVVVPYKAELVRSQDCTQHSGQRDLPGLIHYAHVKQPPLEQRVRSAEACTADLESERATASLESSSDIQSLNNISSLATGVWTVPMFK